MTHNSVESDEGLTIICIATNKYVNYANDLFRSIKACSIDSKLEFIILTDQRFVEKGSSDINVKIVEIGALGWPWATLMRYHLILANSESISYDNLCYIDADSVVERSFWSLVDFKHLKNDLALVEHPGYFRPRNQKFYLKHPKFILTDAKLKFLNYGIGNWEKRRKSNAYVERKSRKKYVCGGVWMGRTSAVLGMSRLLAERINADLDKNIIAKWHDESHINWFFSKNETTLLPPSFCFAPNRKNLQSLQAYVTAVDK